MSSNILELQNLIEGFRLSCQTEGKSPKTIEWYFSFLTRFRHFLQVNQLPTKLCQIKKAQIREFIRYLQIEAKTPRSERPLSGATVQGYVRTLKAFFSWADREGYMVSGQIGRIPIPKASTKVINTFTHDQISKLANICQLSNGNGHRNLTVLLLLLDTGIRVSELVNINLEQTLLK